MPTITPDDLATYLACTFTNQEYDQAEAVITVVIAEVAAWTRGVGFDETGKPNIELWTVIVGASARRIFNAPGMIREGLGGMFVQHAPPGFTLTEQRVLNRHRKRAK